MGFAVRTSVVLLLAAVVAACGSEDRSAERSASAPEASEQTPAPEPRRTTRCGPGRTSAAPLPPAADVAGLRELVLDAAVRATRRGHRFRTSLDVAAGNVRADAVVSGRRTPANASSALVAWSGPASLLLDDVGLRIVDDQLYVRTGGSDAPWSRAGSASGVSLDVGRELLDHPFLLTATRARGDDSDAMVTFDAPASTLRDYATSERRGPVTDLLREARRLTLVVEVLDGVLTSDRFVLVTRVPGSIDLGPVRAGSTIAIRGATTYCPLRTGDRTPIRAPRVSD